MLDNAKIKSLSRRMNWKRKELFDLLSEWIPHIELEDEVPFNRSTCLLNTQDVFYLGDLVAKSRNDLLAIPGMTFTTVEVIERRLAVYNLALGYPYAPWQQYKERCVKEGLARDFSGPEWDEVVTYPSRTADADHSRTVALPARNLSRRSGNRGRRPDL